jgi:hypothetical protein
MEQQALQASSQRWMQAALEALGHGKSLDFAVQYAGVGLECPSRLRRARSGGSGSIR